MKRDNLFDGKFTFLDAVKIFILIVTAFSTWNVVDIITPEGGLSFVREFAALFVVEGAFLAFEKATSDAKSKKQMQIATIGFGISLAVIVLFAAASGLLEFGGETLMSQPAGTFLGLAWTARDVTTVAALMVLVAWIGTLAALQRYYTLEDPEKKLEIARTEANGVQGEEDITALNHALAKTKGTVAKHRALAAVKKTYNGELTPDELAALMADAETELATQYGTPIPVTSETPFAPRNQTMDGRMAELEANKTSLWEAFRSGLIERQPVHTIETKAAPAIPMAKAEKQEPPSYHGMGFPTRSEPSYAPMDNTAKAWARVLNNNGIEDSTVTVQDVIESGDCTVPADAFSDGKMPAATNDLIGQVNGASGVGLPCFLRGYLYKSQSITSACAVCGFNKGKERDDERIAQLTYLNGKAESETE